MEDTIIALLNSNLRVIIPDFGAFIIRQKQPRIIVFNEFLRYNDGILIDFIAKTEGIDHEIAEQRVADFAEDGSKLLASGRELKVEGLGSLKKDSSGKISFIEAPPIMEIETIENPEPEMVAVPVDEPAVLQQAEQVVTEKAISKGASGTKFKVKAAPGKTKSKRLTKTLRESPPPAVTLLTVEPMAIEQTAATGLNSFEPMAVVEAPTVPDAEFNSFHVESVNPETPEPITVIEPPAPVVPQIVNPELPPAKTYSFPAETAGIKDGPSTYSTNRILAWVVIILFVNAGILAWFLFRNKTKDAPAMKSTATMISDTLNDQLADSVRAAARDNNIVFNEVPDKDDVIKSTAAGSRYFIVAGCFRDEINADSLVSSLKLMGYKAEKFGKIGNLFAVCFASFDNKDMAVSELKKIREKVPSAWMTKF